MIVCLRLGLVSVLGCMNGVGSILLYIVIWPMVLVYIRWVTKIVPAFKANEGFKKGAVLCFLLICMFSGWHMLYVIGVGIVNGLLRIIGLGVYVYVMLSLGVYYILVMYVVSLNAVNFRYKALVMGLLPLPVFFIKVCCNSVLLYYVIIYSYFNFLL